VVDIEQAIADELALAAPKTERCMSSKGPVFIRRWLKVDEPLRRTPALAEAFRKDAISAQVKLEEVEAEVGSLEKGLES
jgi:hypothetical protein